MRNFAILFFLILFSLTAFGQKPVKKPTIPSKPAIAPTTFLSSEKEEFEKAIVQTDAAERLNSLKKFVADFPKSERRIQAIELMSAARAQIADEKIRAGDAAGGIEIFKLAIRDAPVPVSDQLFADIILQIPSNLYFRGERKAAAETAEMIEKKVEGSAKHLLGLATYYLGVENAGEAKRLAGKALALEPNLPAAYQTLGLANRLNFNLEEAANSYKKALELDATSTVSRRSLAEMQRALGKPDEAVALYREILAKNTTDASAQNGLILSLFDAEKKAEAEAEMAKSLKENPNNLFLLVGASYWYAAHNNGVKAVELAQKAVAAEPRFVWGYIALARGHLQGNQFLEAERALLAARNYGNFPTLDYEMASVRIASGFYREAAREMAKKFTVKDDSVSTKLGGRVEKQAKSFTDLISLERRASIFEPLAADTEENSQLLKSLLDFHQKLESTDANDAEVSLAADKFLGGGDKMKLHRRLFVADRLLEKKKALPKVMELMKAATGEIEAALNVPNPAAAVLADELFESRARANLRNELVVVPNVSRQTLSNILRGRIEEINGRALEADGKPAEAVIRLKRAAGILPEKSAWWRSSMWRLGSALQSDGKPTEALDAYIKGFAAEDASSDSKRIVIENLYRQVNGSLDGLDSEIGAKPAASNSSIQNTPTETVGKTAEKQNLIVENVPKADDAPGQSVEVKSTAAVNAKIENTPLPATELKTETKIAARQTGSAKNSPAENNSVKTEKPLFEPIIITVPRTETARKCTINVSQENVSLVNNGGNLGVLVGFENDAGDVKEIIASSGNPKDIEIVFEPEIGTASNRAFFIIKSVSSNTGVYTVTFEAPCGKKEITVRVR